MASEETEQEQRTEDASERRLAQAFEQGDIALSREFVMLGGFIAGALVLVKVAPVFKRALTVLITDAVRLAPTSPFSTLPSLLAPLAIPTATIMIAVAAVGIALTFTQTRAHLWDDRATPDFSRLFSPSRVTHFVSKEFAQDLVISLVKLVAVGGVVWTSFRAEFLTLHGLLQATPADQFDALFAPLSKALVRVLAVFAAFAGADFALTHWRYRKKHMMTRDELKREMREDEGDPQIRSMRKRKHRELSKRGAQVVYGDVGNLEVLRHAGVGSAEVIVSTVPDELLKGINNEKLVRMLRTLAPQAIIIANCTTRSGVEKLRAAGADHVFRAATEVALGILPAIYAALNATLGSYHEGLYEQHGPLEAPEVLD